MKKLGVAISVYNKIDEVTTCINVIRKHWKRKDVYVCVCCNDPQNFDKVKSLDIDNFVPGIDYKPEQFSLPKAWKRMRQYDTIKKAVLGCIDEAEFVIQWHGDACALDDSAIFSMLDEMERNDKKVAFRGKWKGHDVCRTKRPYGHVDDHFVIFNSRHVKETRLYNEDTQVEDVAKVAGSWSSEGIMSYVIQNATPQEKLWHYDDMRYNEVAERYCPKDDDERDTFYEDGVWHSSIPPFNFDPHRKFLHSDDEEHTRHYFKKCGIALDLIHLSSKETPTQTLSHNEPESHISTWLDS